MDVRSDPKTMQTIGFSGDLTAQEAFFSRHSPLVEPLARSASRRSPSVFQIEDLRQQGFLGLVIASRTYDAARGPEDHWARFCIRKQILDSLSGPNWWWFKLRHVPSEDRLQPEEEVQPASPPDHAVIEDQLPADLEEAKANLSPLQRQILEMVYEDGKTLKTVGRNRVLGVGWRKIYQEHASALVILQNWFAERGLGKASTIRGNHQARRSDAATACFPQFNPGSRAPVGQDTPICR